MNQVYTVTYFGEKGNTTGQLPRPDELPEPNTILQVQRQFYTLSGNVYKPGDKLILIKRTNKTPHNRLSSLGNWEVQCPFGTTVWTNIEYAMAEGYLKVWK